MLSSANVEFLPGEQIVFEGGSGVLTNRRLLVHVKAKPNDGPDRIVDLSDIVKHEKRNGGEESRMRQGLRFLAGGAVITAVGALGSGLLRELGGIFETVELLLFVVGMVGLLLGLYLVLKSLIRVPPNTTVFFRLTNGDDVPVTFPDRDNRQADELIRLYLRAKSGLSG